MKLKFPILVALPALMLLFACSPSKTSTEQAPSPQASPAATVAAAPSASAAASTSSPAATGKERRNPRMQKLKEALGLAPEQSQKIDALMESRRPAMLALRDDTTMTPEEKKIKFTEIRDSINSQLATILTPEQKTKWDEEQVKMREEMRQQQAERKAAAAAAASTSQASDTASPAASAQ